MKNKNMAFNSDHLQNIKTIFEEQTGVQLTKKKIPFAHYKLVLGSIGVFLCLSIGTPVLAANVPAVYEFMYLISPGMAQFFMPIQRSDEDHGIKMEVVSSYIHDNIAEFYITMQDLTGNRMDETTDLYDSYSINRPFDSLASCRFVGYDKNTKTATFLITIQEWGSRKITGEKITFSVNEFLSHKKTYHSIAVPFDLSLVASASPVQKVEPIGGGGEGYNTMEEESVVLEPSTPISGFPVRGIDITSIGYIEDKLHVQIARNDPLDNDNHGSFYLVSANGKKAEYDYNIYFSNQYESREDRIDYCEYIFDIPREEIKNYSLYGDFEISGMRTEGHWRVTFPFVN